MRLILTIFVSITAILIAAIYQPALFPEFMQAILRKTNNPVLTKLTTQALKTTTTTSTMSTKPTFVGLPVIPANDPSLTSSNPQPRSIAKIFEARSQSEGAGATVRRSIGTAQLRNLTPFLMLDHFRVAPGAGFPDHPHRGMETVTYLLSGAVEHEDFAGHRGKLEAGDLQFMTAGRGIVHAEMPFDDGHGSENVGMQLWVDLPEQLKDCEPRYRDLRAAEIPVAKADGGKVTIKVISGRSQGVDSVQELAYTPVWLLDVTIQPGGRLEQPLPAGWNSFAYILEGSVDWETQAGKKRVEQFHNTVFGRGGDQIIASAPEDAKVDTRLIIVSGIPLDQPIVQYGPFVVTDQNLVRKAYMDYQTHSNGFERAAGWMSEIGKPLMG